MMGRWGLNGMESFAQANVARKEYEQTSKSQAGEPMTS